MKTITVYDPPMCCSTGVCGPEVDPVLPRVAGLLSQLAKAGVHVERHNLAQRPLRFAQNTEVRALLEKEGTDVLPLIFIDGKLEMKGRYPDETEGSAWMKRATDATAETTG
ncbi:MAG: arsenical resistance operon transcriptional repressor ArsD [Puniceicoccaceae bacterium]|nr:MAG: arsenical resistance operon transcriptional repressor ArsD [Puniceicoccaceae bacterium]